MARLIPYMSRNDEMGKKHYIQGLPDKDRHLVKAHAPLDFDAAVELSATLYDDVLAVEEKMEEPEKKWVGSNKRFRGEHGDTVDKRVKTENLGTCRKCRKTHSGECSMKSILCFRCGQTRHFANDCKAGPKCYKCGGFGHISRECKGKKGEGSSKGHAEDKKDDVKPKANARAFTMTKAEAKTDPNVVSGTFLVNDVPASVLFDSGASRSFVAHSFYGKLRRMPRNIEEPFCVETAVGQPTSVTDALDDCFIDLEGHRFPARLFIITLGGFDVVLGMDWLSAFNADIVCREKLIRLTSLEGSLVTVYGDKVCSSPKIISMMKAVKFLRRGCGAYLVYVIDDVVERKELADMPVVCDFPDVFPDDLTGVPPEREIEFQTDLLPGAQPVAIAPYRLAPTEMKELMEQLQDLLDKGFI
ncbi:uncharacterized protein LOC110928338 [Helianthus annuus]|uniref:uncharacterized protein LOC110928338 n=1 Tax=Helianthus annuus TaxID=4232 RepID=UPI000B8F3FBA|nr:uncharacterized protein LOC110928338 [Helianthus annuus]